jgi:hypothetical protein
MMKSVHQRTARRGCLAIGLFLLALGISNPVALAQPAFITETETVLDSYFSALKVGDINLIGDLIAGDLASKRNSLLSNPDYRDILIETYGNADFVVTDYEVEESGSVFATVDIWLDDTEKVRQRITLDRIAESDQLRIVDTEVLP